MSLNHLQQYSRLLNEYDLILMCGLPGSGKSFYAKKFAEELGAEYLSSDVIRLSEVYKNQAKYLDDDKEYVKSRELIYSLLHERMIALVRAGKKVIVDATYLGPQRGMAIDELQKAGLIQKATMVVVRAAKDQIVKRVEKLGILRQGKSYYDGWKQAYDWFETNLKSGEICYPSNNEGIDIVEIVND